MRKRPVVLLACMILIGILWKRTGAVLVVGTGLLLFLYATPWKECGIRFVALAIGMPVILMLGAMCFTRQVAFRDAYLSRLCDGQEIRLAGKLYKVEEKTNCFYYYLTDCSVELSDQTMPCNDVLAYVSSDDDSVGQILILQGTISLFDEATNEGQFDARSFYRSQKIDFGVWVDQVERVAGETDRLRVWLDKVQTELGIPFARYAKDDGVLSAMLLGDKTGLDSEIKSLYQAAGIAHVLAISGLHISLLGMTLYRLLRHRCGLAYLWSGSVVAAFLGMYTVMTGNTVSARRAGGMLLVYLLADLLGRSYDMLSALGIVVMLLLAENPFLVENSGFQFSVAAVVGIGAGQGVLVPWVSNDRTMEKSCPETLQKRTDRLRSWWKKSVPGMMISLSIQLFMIPIVTYYYYEIPIYAILLNIPVLVLVPYVLGCAVVGSLSGQIGFLQPLSFVLCRLCSLVLCGYRWLCDVSLALPGARFITGRPSVTRITVYYALLGAFYYVLWCGMRRRKKKADEEEFRLQTRMQAEKPKANQQSKSRTWMVIRRRLGFAMGIIVLMRILFIRGGSGFELNILDVGQGDGIYLCTSAGVSLMIDGGSSDTKNVGTYRILPFLKSKAVRKVSYWFVSHTDEDHISGIAEVLESGYRVEHLVLAKAQKKDEKAIRLAEIARQNGTAVCYMKAGERLHCGSDESTEVVKCLYPAENEAAADVNDRCLVLYYQGQNFRGFFGGDISSEVEEKIVSENSLLKVDFLKASHHGSKYANSDALLQTLRPSLTVASAGENNRYGHPSQDAIARIHDHGSAFYSTIDCGRIRVKIVGGEIQADAYIPSKEKTFIY